MLTNGETKNGRGATVRGTDRNGARRSLRVTNVPLGLVEALDGALGAYRTFGGEVEITLTNGGQGPNRVEHCTLRFRLLFTDR